MDAMLVIQSAQLVQLLAGTALVIVIGRDPRRKPSDGPELPIILAVPLPVGAALTLIMVMLNLPVCILPVLVQLFLVVLAFSMLPLLVRARMWLAGLLAATVGLAGLVWLAAFGWGMATI